MALPVVSIWIASIVGEGQLGCQPVLLLQNDQEMKTSFRDRVLNNVKGAEFYTKVVARRIT